MADPKKPANPRHPRPKAEPRVSLAPLDFEDALEGLLAVEPTHDPAQNDDGHDFRKDA